MYNYVISNDLITSYQSGFIKGDSTVYQLTFFYYEICQALDGGKEVRAVFLTYQRLSIVSGIEA